MYLTTADALEYACDKQPFYRKEVYSEGIRKLRGGEDLDKILSGFPVIDGDTLKKSYMDLIPNTKAPIIAYLSSGTTGKPKPILKTDYQDLIMAKTVANKIVNPLIGPVDLCITKGPPIPARSGEVMDRTTKVMRSIELAQGPGQNMSDILRFAETLNYTKEKKILMLGFPSALLREVYNMNADDRQYMQTLTDRFNFYLLVGGENLPPYRAKLLNSLIRTNGIIEYLSSTEGFSAYRFYPKAELESDKVDNKPFRFISYDNHFMIKEGQTGRLLPPKDALDKTGELVMTTKADDQHHHVVLINYNTKDVIKVVESLSNGDFLATFLGRSDGIKRFGVGKLDEMMINDIIAELQRKFGTGEGYARITNKEGLDKLTVYIDKKSFNGREEEILKELEDQLSKEMEIMHSLSNEFVSVGVALIDKEQISFYKDRGKSKWLIDERQ